MSSPVQSRCVLLIVSVLLIVQITVANDKPISATPKLFDLTNSKTLGLSTVPGKHVLLYRAGKGDHQFCHHPSLS